MRSILLLLFCVDVIVYVHCAVEDRYLRAKDFIIEKPAEGDKSSAPEIAEVGKIEKIRGFFKFTPPYDSDWYLHIKHIEHNERNELQFEREPTIDALFELSMDKIKGEIDVKHTNVAEIKAAKKDLYVGMTVTSKYKFPAQLNLFELNLVPEKLKLYFADSNDGHFSINSMLPQNMVFKFYKELNVVKTGRIRVETHGSECFLSVNAMHELVCLKSVAEIPPYHKGIFTIKFYKQKDEVLADKTVVHTYYVSIGVLIMNCVNCNTGMHLYINSKQTTGTVKVVLGKEESLLKILYLSKGIEKEGEFLINPMDRSNPFHIVEEKDGYFYTRSSDHRGMAAKFTLIPE